MKTTEEQIEVLKKINKYLKEEFKGLTNLMVIGFLETIKVGFIVDDDLDLLEKRIGEVEEKKE